MLSRRDTLRFAGTACAWAGLGNQAQATTIRRGGRLTLATAYGSSVSTLDPHRTTRTQDDLVSLSIHRSLYRWDATTNRPSPELAESVEESDGATRFRVRLRDGCRFHHGRELTVDDVIWSYHRIMSPTLPCPGARYLRTIRGARDYEAGHTQSIDGLRRIDARTLEIVFEEPTDPGYLLFWPMTSILPRDVVEERGDRFGVEPVGVGPFRFARWVKGSEITLDAFDGFYRPGQPYLDRITYLLMGEDAAKDFAFRSHELDLFKLSTMQSMLYRQDPARSPYLIQAGEVYTRHIGFHPRFVPLQDKRVRQAFNHAIDSTLIVDKLLKGMGVPAKGWLVPSSEAADPNRPGYPYNPDRARALLREAGYGDGFKLEIVTTADKSYGVGIVEAALPYLHRVGIDVRPKVVENAIGQELVFVKGEFDAYMWSFNAGPDPLAALRRFHRASPHTPGNTIFYKNKSFDELLDRAAASSGDQRITLLRQADQLFADDAPMWFFSHAKSFVAYQPWVHGLQASAVEAMYQYLEDVWIDPASPRAGA